MYKIGYTLILWLLTNVVGRILTGAGLALLTSNTMMLFVNYYIDNAMQNLNTVSSKMLGIAGLAGVDVALSILIGAFTAKAAMNAMKITLTKAIK